jgi:hypothetical protein
MDSKEILKRNPEVVDPTMINVPYAAASISIRPDISFVLNRLAQFTSSPTPAHWKSVDRYLLHTKHNGITFERKFDNNGNLIGYSDADFAGDYDDHSPFDIRYLRIISDIPLLRFEPSISFADSKSRN